MPGSGVGGRYEGSDYDGTPLGLLGAANADSAGTDTPGAPSDEDFEVDTDAYPNLAGTQAGGGDTIYRLREGIERFMITDINNAASSNTSQSIIPVMWDHLTPQIKGSSHVPAGMNVLFMDGHVTFCKYPVGDVWMTTIDGPRIIGRYDREFI